MTRKSKFLVFLASLAVVGAFSILVDACGQYSGSGPGSCSCPPGYSPSGGVCSDGSNGWFCNDFPVGSSGGPCYWR